MLPLLAEIINYLIFILSTIVMVSFVFGLLIVFNVISLSNDYVASIYQALNAILEPILKPIRKIMPDTGMIDFSPMVLLIGLNILSRVISYYAQPGVVTIS